MQIQDIILQGSKGFNHFFKTYSYSCHFNLLALKNARWQINFGMWNSNFSIFLGVFDDVCEMWVKMERIRKDLR